MHGGLLFGYDCLITLFPDLQLGIYTAFNGPMGMEAFLGNLLIQYHISDMLLGLDTWLNETTLCSYPTPWLHRAAYLPHKEHVPVNQTFQATRPLVDYVGTYGNLALGNISVYLNESESFLRMSYGRIGKFRLHPNGPADSFRLDGVGVVSFLTVADAYAPTTWMTASFNVTLDGVVESFEFSLIEPSSPSVFTRDLKLPAATDSVDDGDCHVTSVGLHITSSGPPHMILMLCSIMYIYLNK